MNLKSKIVSGITALWTLFIYSNSLKTGTASGSMSGGFVSFVMDLLNKFGWNPDSDVITVLIRKSAHVTEYLILGLLLTLIFTLSGKQIRFYAMNIMFLGMTAALTDEFIQTFTPGRSGEVRDVIIDFCGVLLGILIVCLFARRQRSPYSRKR